MLLSGHMSYKEKYGLTRDWWQKKKQSYIFDEEWFKPFAQMDSRLDYHEAKRDKDTPTTTAIVFMHEEDGRTLLPVGLVARFGDENLFMYHPDYVDDPDTKPIARALPKSHKLYKDENAHALLPFFDNLVSEGWLGLAQRNAYHRHHEGKIVNDEQKFAALENGTERFRRLATFGSGFQGAVSVVDVAVTDLELDKEHKDVQEALTSRGSLTGAQPKMLAVERPIDSESDQLAFRGAARNETSQFIVKIGQTRYKNIVPNEFLNVVATEILNPDDVTHNVSLGTLARDDVPVLVLDRFDRTPQGGRIHFEEALSLLEKPAHEKYSHSYKELGRLTRELAGEEEVKRLFRRIITHWLLGNTDGHWKNFAFWEKDGKWQLTPNYDLVSADEFADRKNYANKVLPMAIEGNRFESKKRIGDVNPKTIFALGRALELDDKVIHDIVQDVKNRIPKAVAAVRTIDNPLVTDDYKERFAERLEQRAHGQYDTLDKYFKYSANRQGGQRSLGG